MENVAIIGVDLAKRHFSFMARGRTARLLSGRS